MATLPSGRGWASVGGASWLPAASGPGTAGPLQRPSPGVVRGGRGRGVSGLLGLELREVALLLLEVRLEGVDPLLVVLLGLAEALDALLHLVDLDRRPLDPLEERRLAFLRLLRAVPPYVSWSCRCSALNAVWCLRMDAWTLTYWACSCRAPPRASGPLPPAAASRASPGWSPRRSPRGSAGPRGAAGSGPRSRRGGRRCGRSRSPGPARRAPRGSGGSP